MARPARFERATAWFVARYSIQLSYGRVQHRSFTSPVREVFQASYAGAYAVLSALLLSNSTLPASTTSKLVIPVVVARPARFERATAWFVARYSIQLSYGRVDWRNRLRFRLAFQSAACGFKPSALTETMAEREGFEPSIGFLLYTLSRGAPSATRPSLQTTARMLSCFSQKKRKNFNKMKRLAPFHQHAWALAAYRSSSPSG